MRVDPRKLVARFNGFSIGARIVIALALGLLVVGLGIRFADALHVLIFGNTEAKREQGNTRVAQEQTKAESNIAAGTIQTVHERDVYREHVTNIVREGQENIHAVDHGQPMDPAIDAATADALCRVHDSLCRPGAAPPVQPVR
jgi:hypothetical protein